MGWAGAEMVLDYWSLECQVNGMVVLGPSPHFGLAGDKYGPGAPEAGLLPL